MTSLTTAVIDADWMVRRRTGLGLRRDRLDPDGADPDAPASFATSVIRLPAGLATRLEAVAETIAQAQPGQYVCPARTIHVTVCGPIHVPDGQTTAVAISDLLAVAPRLVGGSLKVVRIGVGDTSVFAALDEVDLDLRGARRELARRWAVAGRGGIGGIVAGRLLWANLIRFTRPPSRELFDAVQRVRRVRHAGFSPEAVELVSTNRTMSDRRTTLLARVEIPRRGAPP